MYPNGVSVSKANIDALDIIPGSPAHDREFINKIFLVFFTNSYIRKQMKNGADRKTILKVLREKKRYDTVQGKKN